MKLRTFLHSDQNSPTTLSEIQRAHDWIASEEFFGIFAYATQSGASSFSIAMAPAFWVGTQSRWLFGLDYGRTQPQALRIISGKPNAEVRVYDGAWIVEQNGFLPPGFSREIIDISEPDQRAVWHDRRFRKLFLEWPA